MEEETWISVTDYEGLYEVSTLGNIRSLDRVVKTKRGLKSYKGKKLNPSKSSAGYKEIRLYKVGVGKTFLVHRLVAIEFLPNPNGYPIINHKDGDKLNPEVGNLEWTTYETNNLHAYSSRLNQNKKKLNPNDIVEIKELYKSRVMTQSEIAKKYAVSQNTISRAIRK